MYTYCSQFNHGRNKIYSEHGMDESQLKPQTNITPGSSVIYLYFFLERKRKKEPRIGNGILRLHFGKSRSQFSMLNVFSYSPSDLSGKKKTERRRAETHIPYLRTCFNSNALNPLPGFADDETRFCLVFTSSSSNR